MTYRVVEKFISINGEGQLTGQLAVFIRFAGCNLDCRYCDTSWANKADVDYEKMSENQIYDYIRSSGVKNITITGGEPLLQENIDSLLELLSTDKELTIEIETNGSVDIERFKKISKDRLRFVLDYKSPSSGMEDQMIVSNYRFLNKNDTVKFVVGSQEDLQRARYIIEEHKLAEITKVYLSPIFGQIEMEDIVSFMIENRMNKVSLQAQLHKIIWDPQKRGV